VEQKKKSDLRRTRTGNFWAKHRRTTGNLPVSFKCLNKDPKNRKWPRPNDIKENNRSTERGAQFKNSRGKSSGLGGYEEGIAVPLNDRGTPLHLKTREKRTKFGGLKALGPRGGKKVRKKVSKSKSASVVAETGETKRGTTATEREDISLV